MSGRPCDHPDQVRRDDRGSFLKAYDPTNIGNNLEFRKALNLAIDRNALFKAMYPPGTADIGDRAFSRRDRSATIPHLRPTRTSQTTRNRCSPNLDTKASR